MAKTQLIFGIFVSKAMYTYRHMKPIPQLDHMLDLRMHVQNLGVAPPPTK